MNKGQIFQYYWDKDMKAIILFWKLLWFSIARQSNTTITGYAFTITIIGFNITFKISKNKKGILKTYGIS
tara:strand:- start:597 stop:806 length:210 start_codon:yes stop_codon:yes gene_type:complete